MSKSCSNFRAFHFIRAPQSLETGDKGSHPFPVATMEISPNTSKWCWRREVAFGWDHSLVSCVQKGVGDCGLISFGPSHRNMRVCSFGVHHFTVSGSVSRPHFTFEDHVHLPVKLFLSQWENVLRSCGGTGVVFNPQNTEVINWRSRGERMLQPSSGCTDPALL